MYHVLLVDDDRMISQLMRRYLEKSDFSVSLAHDIHSALASLDKVWPDLVLVDIMLPDGSGLELIHQLRQVQGIPVIMMTARGGIDDKATAFRRGADDYIVKPFDPNELVLRVQAVIRRIHETETGVYDPRLSQEALTLGRPGTMILTIDPDTMTVQLDDQKIDLPRREFQLLYLLAANSDQTLTREQITDHIWGMDFDGELRVVDLYIDRLRKRLRVDNNVTCDWSIRTVRGLGYRIEVTT